MISRRKNPPFPDFLALKQITKRTLFSINHYRHRISFNFEFGSGFGLETSETARAAGGPLAHPFFFFDHCVFDQRITFFFFINPLMKCSAIVFSCLAHVFIAAATTNATITKTMTGTGTVGESATATTLTNVGTSTLSVTMTGTREGGKTKSTATVTSPVETLIETEITVTDPSATFTMDRTIKSPSNVPVSPEQDTEIVKEAASVPAAATVEEGPQPEAVPEVGNGQQQSASPAAQSTPAKVEPQIKQKNDQVPSVIFDTAPVDNGSTVEQDPIPNAGGSSINQDEAPAVDTGSNGNQSSSTSSMPIALAITGAAAIVCIGGFLLYKRKTNANLKSLVDLSPGKPHRKNPSTFFPSFQRKDIYSFSDSESGLPFAEPKDLSKERLGSKPVIQITARRPSTSSLDGSRMNNRRPSNSSQDSNTQNSLSQNSTTASYLSNDSKEIADAALFMAGIDSDHNDSRISIDSNQSFRKFHSFDFSDGLMLNEYRIGSMTNQRDTVRDSRLAKIPE